MISLRKPETFRDEEYTAWIRTLPCCACGKPADDAHHVRFAGQGSTSMKPSDYQTIPVCRGDHSFYHNHGRPAFEREFGLNLYQVIVDCLSGYIQREEGSKHG